MRYIHFFGNNGYCGTDYHEFETFPDDTLDEIIEGISTDKAIDHAQDYSYLATGWGEEFESEEAENEYYDDACNYCGWTELSKQEWEDMKEDYE